MKLLHIDSSILGQASASRSLSAEIVAELTRQVPSLTVVRRDLAADPIPHLEGKAFVGRAPNTAADEETKAQVARDEAVLQEFLDAEYVVIGAPMYNFGVPSQLKAWLDRIAVGGKTFRYTDKGPVGLVGGKKVFIASSRGGLYSPGMPSEAFDFQETYLRAFFRFLGIENPSFVRAEGIAFGPEHREKALTGALESVPSTVASASLSKAA